MPHKENESGTFAPMRPFVKWAGGKKQLLDALLARVPSGFATYYEPFIGGGALLFALKPHRAVIGDINEQLTNAYLWLQKDADAVLRAIRRLDESPCSKEYYLAARNRYNAKIAARAADAECAALMIWINKHCFNGLYRVNRKGMFNVPYNNRQSGKSADDDNIAAIASFLSENSVQIGCCDFEETCRNVKKGDFVYFDSPYLPVSATARFTDYAKDGFSMEDHRRLAELYRRLDGTGAYVLLSNHDVEAVHELYDGYTIERTDVRRAINRDASKRRGKEVLVRNY